MLGNTMGTWKTYWEHHEKSLENLSELDGNIMLTSWELIENLLRTHWEQEENENFFLHLHSLQTQKYVGAMLRLFIGCMQFLILKLLVTDFGLD